MNQTHQALLLVLNSDLAGRLVYPAFEQLPFENKFIKPVFDFSQAMRTMTFALALNTSVLPAAYFLEVQPVPYLFVTKKYRLLDITPQSLAAFARDPEAVGEKIVIEQQQVRHSRKVRTLVTSSLVPTIEKCREQGATLVLLFCSE